jgi:glycosyltransferase involved in cell wall biosynthesis
MTFQLMTKLRIAVVVEENCLPTEGGGYSYYQALIKEIDQHQFPELIDICFLLPESARGGYAFSKRIIRENRVVIDKVAYALMHKCYRIIHWLSPDNSKLLLESLTRRMSKLANRNAVAALKRDNTDLVYYLKPNDNPMDFPMMVTHWDVGHKSMYPFPEVASHVNYQKRESYYAQVLNRALVIICESVSGAQELAKFYPINEEKLKVMPLFAGEVVQFHLSEKEQAEVLSNYDLKPQGFFLYPAQFWAHKNHFNLITAFHQLSIWPENGGLKLVLCGADKGNMAYIREVVKYLRLENQVIFTGFINNRVLHALYRNALALVMPTYLGPTNLPLIEAAMLRCAVICSDLEGHREILGESAIYVNPANADDIEQAMGKMLVPDARNRFSQLAFEHISRSSFHLQKSLKVLEKILLDIRPVRKSWGNISRLMQLITYANIGAENL